MSESKEAVLIAMKMNSSSENVDDYCVDQRQEEEFVWKKPLELFAEKEVVKICAPMVRYSK